MSRDERTTPRALQLRSLILAIWGAIARCKGEGEPSRRAPVTLLLAHAIELYLKAFLRLRGLGIEVNFRIPSAFLAYTFLAHTREMSSG